MPNTANFNWATPADTDLVKDGAAAIRTLGNSIDTSFVDLKGGTTGQVLSKTSNTDLDFTWTDGGDITAVVAGTGLSGGGTSGSVTLTNTVATAFDAAGDLVYGTGADTFTKLGIGTANQVLRVNSGATAPEWATVGAAGISLITRQTISASSGTNIDSIFSSTYTNYFITIDNINGSTSSNDLQLQLRYGTTTQTSTHYKYRDFEFGGTLASTDNTADFVTLTPNLGSGTDGSFVTGYISKVGNSSQKPQFQLQLQDQSSGVPRLLFGKVNEEQTYTGIRLLPNAGTFSCTVSIYGLAKS